MNTENTPEKKNTDSVLDAFERSYDSDEEFRERWKRTVEEAKRRKEERLLAEEERRKREEDIKRRAAVSPRVTDEPVPGKPLDISALARTAAAGQTKEKKNDVKAEPAAESEEAVTDVIQEKNGGQSPDEPDTLDFDAYAALSESNELADENNSDIPMPSVRDTDKKLGTREKIRFRFKTRFSKDGFKRFSAEHFPVKGDSASEIVRKCVRGVSFVALVCALVFLGRYYIDYAERIKDTAGFEENMEKYNDLGEDEIEDAWAKIRTQYPEVEFPEGMNIKFSELYAINQHVVGWLTVPNTKINTVLLQANNNSYHLHMNIYDEYTRFGNPYVNYKCKMGKNGLSQNTILYGHNANDGLMFHDLIKYMTVEGYLNSPVITLDTLYEQTKWKVFAVVLTNSQPDEDNGNVWQYLYTDFSSTSHFKRILNEIDERTIIRTGVDVNTNDKLLTLYTCCTYQLDSGRLAVFARQLREGESEEIDTSRVYYNSNARYPQEWYTRKNRVNPFADPTEATTEKETTTTSGRNEDETKRPDEERTTEKPTEKTTEKPTENVTPTTSGPGDTPSGEAPSENTTAAETPSEENTTSETPATDAPPTDPPSTETAATEAPATDAPATEAATDKPAQAESADESSGT